MSISYIRNTNVDEARVIQVIEVVSVAGEGSKESPVHQVREYFSVDGELLARRTFRDDMSMGKWGGEEAA